MHFTFDSIMNDFMNDTYRLMQKSHIKTAQMPSATKEKIFGYAKVLGLLALLISVFYVPKLFLHVLALNILMTIAFQFDKVLNTLLCILLIIWLYHIKSASSLFGWIIFYSLWNVYFIHVFGWSVYNAIISNLIPFIVTAIAAYSYSFKVDKLFYIWAVSRCISVLCYIVPYGLFSKYEKSLCKSV